MKSKIFICLLSFLFLTFICKTAFAQKKLIGTYRDCDSTQEYLNTKEYIYQTITGFSICSTQGFVTIGKDTLVDGKQTQIIRYFPCDTCGIECTNGYFKYKKEKDFIVAIYYDYFKDSITTINLCPLVKGNEIDYVSFFKKPYENKYEVLGKIKLLKSTMLKLPKKIVRSCYVFSINNNIKSNQTIFRQLLFVDKKLLIPMRYENYDRFNNLINCSAFFFDK